jgi:DNA-binding transcriptional MerR regulator
MENIAIFPIDLLLPKQTGLSKDTIRFYEKLGLITSIALSTPSPENRQARKCYKKYSLETITYGRLRQRTTDNDYSRQRAGIHSRQNQTIA